MATFFKEVVNFDDMGNGCTLSLCVVDGKGVGVFACGSEFFGKLSLFLREEEISCDIIGGQAEIHFQTDSRWYYACVFQNDKLVCSGGNSPNLKSQHQVPKILATDTFEAEVANFNYYEKELGELGKSAESILESVIQNGVGKVKTAKSKKKDTQVANVEMPTSKAEAEVEKQSNVEIQTADVENQTADVEAEVETQTANVENATQAPQSEEKNAQRKKGGRKKAENYEKMAKSQVEKMLGKFPREEYLEEVLENSRWAKVEYSKGVYYAVGIIYGDDMVQYIGYAVRGNLNNPPDIENPQFLPLDMTREDGEGYFLIFQKE